MSRRDRGGRRGDDGLTLVELLVSIVVMGILVGIVVIGVAQFRGDSVAEACKADKKIVTSAANAYELKLGSFPNDLEDLETAGYVKNPPGGVTYTFDGINKTVSQGPCNL